MEAIMTAANLSGVATAIGALLVTGVGIRILYAGYRFVKKALGTA